MRLIGGKDYYDGVTGFDSDDRLIFVRQQFNKAEHRETPYDLDKPELIFGCYGEGETRYSRYGNVERDFAIKAIKMIFCGKLYTGILVAKSGHELTHNTSNEPITSFWSADALREELVRLKLHLPKDKQMYYEYGSHNNAHYVTDEELETFFTPVDVPKRVLDVLVAENIVHSIRFGMTNEGNKSQHKWFDNTDGLKRIGFAAVVDPWQTYQQIDMWLGSQLAKDEDNMVKLGDAAQIAKHGFDKFSFRNQNHPGKPRGRT